MRFSLCRSKMTIKRQLRMRWYCDRAIRTADTRRARYRATFTVSPTGAGLVARVQVKTAGLVVS